MGNVNSSFGAQKVVSDKQDPKADRN